MSTEAKEPAHQRERAQPSMDSMDGLSFDARKALEFEKAYRAHPSVFSDPFYKAPPESSSTPAGTLLKVERETDPNLYNLPPNNAISRFMYQSRKADGSLVPATGYILWPYTARKFPQIEGYPVVVWAHGTSGIYPECAPSNLKGLWHDFQAVYQLTLNGYVVVATDYAGLGVSADARGNPIVHEWLTGPAQGNDLVFSVPAAREAFPELSQEFVIIGSSEGGQAAWAAAERLHSEPLQGHLGTIPLSPLTRLLSIPGDLWGVPPLLLMLVPGLQQRYPDFKPEDILTPKGIETLQTLQTFNGTNTLLFQLPFGHDCIQPNWKSNRHIKSYQELAYTGSKQLSGPLLVIHGDNDPLVTTQSVTDAVHATAKVCPSTHIAYYLLPHVSHAPVMYAGQTVWMDWIAARFAGEPLEPGMYEHVVKPIRPATTQLKEVNWFVQNQTESWQSK